MCKLRIRTGSGMRVWHHVAGRALLVGVGPRLAVVALLVMALWAAFFWATSTPGNL